jgi:aerobic C4-dicarboxylate transport protein
MVIAPIVFLTIVLGIANMRDLKRVGRVGREGASLFRDRDDVRAGDRAPRREHPQAGAGLVVSSLAKSDISTYVTAGKSMTFADFVTHIVPSSVVDAFAKGDMLQVVFVAVLFGVALAFVGEDGRAVTHQFEALSRVFFRIVAIVMMVAPIGAFGAMAYTIGAFGLAALVPLGRLMLGVYTTMALFIFVVLNAILRAYGFSLWSYLKFIREEILIVLGTSSSEAALPRMLAKMERYGCAKSSWAS